MRRGVTSDVEAPSGTLKRRLVSDAQHGALCDDDDDVDDEEAFLTSFMSIYDSKIEKIKEKECGKNKIPISGNLYMYKAVAPFADNRGLFPTPLPWFANIGLFLICILQILAPFTMMLNAIQNIQFGEDSHGHKRFFGVSEFAVYQYHSDDHGISHVLMRLLGLIFLILFLMNGLYVLQVDQVETAKVFEMCLLFKSVGKKLNRDLPPEEQVPLPRTRWLWLGAIINSLCLLLCSCAMVFVFIIEEGPKDLVLDAFGLAFLYNLDDIGTELAFLDEKWDEDIMGDMYGDLYEGVHEDDAGVMTRFEEKRLNQATPDNIYLVMRYFVRFLSIVLPLIYMFLEMKPK